jgi:hypothetical protein
MLLPQNPNHPRIGNAFAPTADTALIEEAEAADASGDKMSPLERIAALILVVAVLSTIGGML